MKTIYEITAICTCKDEATMHSIATSLMNSLKTQKTNGNVLDGSINQNVRELTESSTTSDVVS